MVVYDSVKPPAEFDGVLLGYVKHGFVSSAENSVAPLARLMELGPHWLCFDGHDVFCVAADVVGQGGRKKMRLDRFWRAAHATSLFDHSAPHYPRP